MPYIPTLVLSIVIELVMLLPFTSVGASVMPNASGTVLSHAVPSAVVVPQLRKAPYLIFDGSVINVLYQLNSTLPSQVWWGLSPSALVNHIDIIEFSSLTHQHQYAFAGLPFATKYYFQVRIPATGEASLVGSFTTPPDPADLSVKTLQFLLYGDVRTLSLVHNNVSRDINDFLDENPAMQTFTLFNGDFVTNGNNDALWDIEFFNISKTPYVAELVARQPYQACRGNHEGTASIFRRLFPFPFQDSYGCYWSWDYGPAHITVLDAYADFDNGTEQIAWLENDLKTTTKKWKFISVHAAGWTAGPHIDEPDMVVVKTVVQALCAKYGAQMILSGHNHNYARAIGDHGVVHLTCGGGGAPLGEIDPTQPNVIVAYMLNSFCALNLQGDFLYQQAFSSPNRTLLDTDIVIASQFWKVWYETPNPVSGCSGKLNDFDNTFVDGPLWNQPYFNDTLWLSLDGTTPFGDPKESQTKGSPDPCRMFTRKSVEVVDPIWMQEKVALQLNGTGVITVYLNARRIFYGVLVNHTTILTLAPLYASYFHTGENQFAVHAALNLTNPSASTHLHLTLKFIPRTDAMEVTIRPSIPTPTPLPAVNCVGAFGPPGPCSQSCGTGFATSTYTVTSPPVFGGTPCPFSTGATGSTPCNTQPCPQNCVGVFGDPTPCSKSCGTGSTSTTYVVLSAEQNWGAKCAFANGYTNSSTCNTQPCPIDCIGSFGPPSACSASCGKGSTITTFLVQTYEANNGMPCRYSNGYSYTSSCNTQFCPIDCFGYFGYASPCSKSCGSGQSQATYAIAAPAMYGGKPCPHEAHFVNITICNTQPCPQNCIGAFGNATRCSKTCGGGVSTTRYKVLSSAKGGGTPCPYANNFKFTNTCNSQPCPIKCVGAFSIKKTCSKTCGGGVSVWRYHISVNSRNNGTACPYPEGKTISRICNTKACPRINCVGGFRRPNTTCSKSCGGGIWSEIFVITQAAANGGKNCSKANGATRAVKCATNPCPRKCVGKFVVNKPCSKSCGVGVQSSVFRVSTTAKYGGLPCNYTNGATKSQRCNTKKC